MEKHPQAELLIQDMEIMLIPFTPRTADTTLKMMLQNIANPVRKGEKFKRFKRVHKNLIDLHCCCCYANVH